MKKIIAFSLVFMMLLSFTGLASAADNTSGKKDIVDTAVQAGDFKILAAALEKAGLVETLKGKDHSLYLLQQMRLSTSF
ncbi:hypothetical protein [Cytobacillus firmus]|uniref:hypothetical protein n=1 Tax=Cytobacillus firmus TaxID=1399 RepID=UPI0024C1A78F|nr:hypothetical protein [Cytobacillus firmus]WHY59883.1 hypothetical protein QNH42_14965 [Cytobacillus firmus]